MRISDWSSDVCSSDLRVDWVLDETHSHWERRTSRNPETIPRSVLSGKGILDGAECCKCGCALFGTNFELTCPDQRGVCLRAIFLAFLVGDRPVPAFAYIAQAGGYASIKHRSEEHTSELQSLMRISYAVFCLKKKK